MILIYIFFPLGLCRTREEAEKASSLHVHPPKKMFGRNTFYLFLSCLVLWVVLAVVFPMHILNSTFVAPQNTVSVRLMKNEMAKLEEDILRIKNDNEILRNRMKKLIEDRNSLGTDFQHMLLKAQEELGKVEAMLQNKVTEMNLLNQAISSLTNKNAHFGKSFQEIWNTSQLSQTNQVVGKALLSGLCTQKNELQHTNWWNFTAVERSCIKQGELLVIALFSLISTSYFPLPPTFFPFFFSVLNKLLLCLKIFLVLGKTAGIHFSLISGLDVFPVMEYSSVKLSKV